MLLIYAVAHLLSSICRLKGQFRWLRALDRNPLIPSMASLLWRRWMRPQPFLRHTWRNISLRLKKIEKSKRTVSLSSSFYAPAINTQYLRVENRKGIHVGKSVLGSKLCKQFLSEVIDCLTRHVAGASVYCAQISNYKYILQSPSLRKCRVFHDISNRPYVCGFMIFFLFFNNYHKYVISL